MRTELHGPRVVARAWTDPGFRSALLSDAAGSIRELGLTLQAPQRPHLRLRVVENTTQIHNLVVCTPCSCHPRALLGEPPAWYASELTRARAATDPAAFLAELGMRLKPHASVRVWDGTAGTSYMVLPQRPVSTVGWTADDLAELVTPGCLIGTELPDVSPASHRPVAGCSDHHGWA